MKLVLFSGGVDSTTCLALAKTLDRDVRCISFDYGQRHREAELKAAKNIAAYYDVPFEILDIKPIFAGGKSSLTNENMEMSLGAYADQEDLNTEVEFRNGVFIAILTSIALQYGADEIYYGAHQDSGGNIYPDCSPEFFKAMADAVYFGSGKKVRLNAPFINGTKADIVKKGLELGVPYEMTYSCYMGTNPPCGKCGTCIDRKKAFEANGLDLI